MHRKAAAALGLLGISALSRLARAGPYAPAAGQPGSVAVSNADPDIQGWASGYLNYIVGPTPAVDSAWQDPTQALGQAEGNSFNIVSLGDGGAITLIFNAPITDGPGFDFAVFENAFNDTFLELAYVEVSADGTNFVRFPTASLTPGPVPFWGGSVDPTNIDGLAGKYRQGFGTPFDLAAVALSQATHVRLVDVIGDGRCLDSSARPIYDPYPTMGSVGFDVDGVAVLHALISTHVGGSSNWSTGGGWNTGAAPNGVGKQAIIQVTGAKTVTLDVPVTLGSLTFDDLGSDAIATLAGSVADPLTLETSSGQALLTIRSGSHLISAPVVLNADTRFIIGQTSAPAALGITGMLNASGKNIMVDAGSSASVLTVQNFRADGVSINAGVLRIAPGGGDAGTSVLSSVPGIGASGNFDLNDNKLVVDYVSPGPADNSPAATIRTYLITGRGAIGVGNGETWAGTGGISSSTTANADPTGLAVGYREAQPPDFDIAAVTSFGGQSVDDTAILLRYTYAGDANLDGKVDRDDLNILSNSFGQTEGVDWLHGDFDYNGTCDRDDFNLLSNNFGSDPIPSASTLTAVYGSDFATAFQRGRALAAASAAPEPSTPPPPAAGPGPPHPSPALLMI